MGRAAKNRVAPPLSPPKNFGWRDYVRMFRAKGIRLPWSHFLQAHWFDKRYGIETHTWISKDYLSTVAEAISPHTLHGQLYMVSWTCVVKQAFKLVTHLLKAGGVNLSEAIFLDIGCGKGKVVILWAMLLQKYCRKYDLSGVRLLGLDYASPLVEVAQDNVAKLMRKGHLHPTLAPQFYVTDITHFHFGDVGRGDAPLILYLYNPFNEIILKAMLENMALTLETPNGPHTKEVIIIYNNPVHADVLKKDGFTELWQKQGWHPNATTTIFKKDYYLRKSLRN